MRAHSLIILGLACLPFTACVEQFSVTAQGYSGWRFGTDVGAENYEVDPTTGKVSYQRVKTNNSKSFKAGAGVANSAIGAYGLLGSAKEMTAQRASDNALKAKQASEATKQQGILSAPTKFLPAEGEAISRAGGAVVIP